MLRSSAKSYWVIDTHQTVSSKTKQKHKCYLSRIYPKYGMYTRTTLWANTKYIHVNTSTLRTVYASSLFSKNITSSNLVMVRRFVKQAFEKQHSFTLNIPLVLKVLWVWHHVAETLEGKYGFWTLWRKIETKLKLKVMLDFQFFEKKVLIFSIKAPKIVFLSQSTKI